MGGYFRKRFRNIVILRSILIKEIDSMLLSPSMRTIFIIIMYGFKNARHAPIKCWLGCFPCGRLFSVSVGTVLKYFGGTRTVCSRPPSSLLPHLPTSHWVIAVLAELEPCQVFVRDPTSNYDRASSNLASLVKSKSGRNSQPILVSFRSSVESPLSITGPCQLETNLISDITKKISTFSFTSLR